MKYFFVSLCSILVAACIGTIGVYVYLKRATAVSVEKKYMILEQQLQLCQELTTIKKQYSEIASIKKQAALGLAKSYSIIKYAGIIRVGIENLEDVTFSIDADADVITVTIPKPTILGNDLTSLEVFDEKQSIFIPIQTQEIFAEVQASRQQTTETLIQQGLLEEAQKATEAVINTLLLSIGYKTSTIQLKWKS